MSNLHTYREDDGAEIQPGDTITDFRGDTAVFAAATRAREPGRSGLVLTQDGGEYYDKVFRLRVVDLDLTPQQPTTA